MASTDTQALGRAARGVLHVKTWTISNTTRATTMTKYANPITGPMKSGFFKIAPLRYRIRTRNPQRSRGGARLRRTSVADQSRDPPGAACSTRCRAPYIPCGHRRQRTEIPISCPGHQKTLCPAWCVAGALSGGCPGINAPERAQEALQARTPSRVTSTGPAADVVPHCIGSRNPTRIDRAHVQSRGIAGE